MKKTVITIPSFVITTILYALAATTFFEIDKALGEGENFVVYDDDKTLYTQQQVVEKPCKSLVHLLQKCASQCVHRND